jgi:hypothetical protein
MGFTKMEREAAVDYGGLTDMTIQNRERHVGNQTAAICYPWQ